jgi:hypothetical protein|tara:strand:- start:775 stop:1065 length:291 start_codon:yes stop_codon:yes gene_type:complete
MTKLKGNRPLDRDYFKYKDRPKKKGEKDVTPCCGKSLDRVSLNVNIKEDWKIIEDHIEDKLRDYPHTESITPVSCEDCGRLLSYSSVLKRDKKYFR